MTPNMKRFPPHSACRRSSVLALCWLFSSLLAHPTAVVGFSLFSSTATRPPPKTKKTTNTKAPAPVRNNQDSHRGEPFEQGWLEKLDRFLTSLQNPQEQWKNHTYLSGNYKPVQQEHVLSPVTEIVQGAIPPTLNGMFCRNGPNPIIIDNDNDNQQPQFRKLYHWFDGHAMLHNLQFDQGQACYTNQFVPSTRYQVERHERRGDQYFPTLGEYTGLWGLIKILFHPTMVRQRVPDLKRCLPPNTNVLMHQNKLYCLNEGNLPFECQLKPDGTLEAVGFETLGGVLDFPISAHPRVDPDNGDLLFHSYTTNVDIIEQQGTMKVGRYTGGGNSENIEDKNMDDDSAPLAFYFVPNLNLPNSKDYVSFAHGLVHSQNYMIVWDCSVHFDPAAMFDGGSYFRSKDEYHLKFGLVPKDGASSADDVIWIDTGGKGAVVHPLNAWEDEATGEVVLWTPFCENLELDLETDDINRFDMVEYRFQPATGKMVSKRVIDDSVNVEFSVVANMGKFERFGYTAIQDPNTPGEGSFSGLCIWDMAQERLYKRIDFPEGQVGGEPMVATDKTTGITYVGTYLYDLNTEESFFVLYHGETGELTCKMKMPHRVPFGFHGQWFSSEELQGHFRHHGLAVEERSLSYL